MEFGTRMGLLKDASRQQFINDEQARLKNESELQRCSERQAHADREYLIGLENNESTSCYKGTQRTVRNDGT